MSEFLRVKGMGIVLGKEKIRLRGVNIGNWMLLEHYMLGLHWIDNKIRNEFIRVLGEEAYHSFFDAYMGNYVDEDDFAFLKECGFNTIRLPFSYHHFEDDMNPGHYLEDGFRYLDKIISLCRKSGMYLIPVIYSVPGAQARDHNAESIYGEAVFWDMKDHQERLYGFWRAFARRYKDEPTIMGYELLEEPLTNKVELMNKILLKCIHAVREEDRNHILIVQSNMWGEDVTSLHNELFDDPQVIPTMHHYHQKYEPYKQMKEYPGEFDGRYYGREELLSCMKGAYDLERIKRPVLVGEFGMGTYLSNYGAMLSMMDDILGFFEEKGFHWTFWNYKDLGAMGLVYPAKDTPWLRFLNGSDVKPFVDSLFESVKRFNADMQKLMAGKGIEKDYVDYLPDHAGQLVQRLALSHQLNCLKKYSNQELAEMGRSYAFGNCVVRQEFVNLLKKFIHK